MDVLCNIADTFFFCLGKKHKPPAKASFRRRHETRNGGEWEGVSGSSNPRERKTSVRLFLLDILRSCNFCLYSFIWDSSKEVTTLLGDFVSLLEKCTGDFERGPPLVFLNPKLNDGLTHPASGTGEFGCACSAGHAKFAKDSITEWKLFIFWRLLRWCPLCSSLIIPTSLTRRKHWASFQASNSNYGQYKVVTIKRLMSDHL